MAQTRVNCPNCQQPIMADVQQLFDVAEDPSAKSKLLSGASNFVQCQVCGYQGSLATPIVYHDPEKELLLTYLPAEIGLPRDEQERLLGGLINQVVNNLPAEQRKAYLFTPRANLTMQSLVEQILEADGITKEMIEAQKEKMELLQRLATASDEGVRLELLKEQEDLIDADLFNILTRLMETAAGTGDQESARQLEEIQTLLIDNTDYGREIKQQSEEVQAAVTSLQAAGKELTREKLLDLVIDAPNEIRLSAYVSLARPGMDYSFFQLLSERIDQTSGDERERLESLREQLLDMTQQLDAQVQARAGQAQQLLNQIVQSDDVTAAIQQNAPQIDEFFLQALQQALEEARKSGDLDKINKLNQIEEMIRQASEQPPEIEFLEELLEAPDEETRQQLLESNQEKITPEFFQMLSGLMAQVADSDQEPELVAKFQDVNRQVLRFSMRSNLQGE
ncbi:MAG: CpXC domain-containing protein [Anaerolineales bacterium]